MTLTDEMKEFDFDIRQKKLELYSTWEDVFEVAKALVAQAKADPLSVKATLLAQVVRILSQSSKILKEADEFRAEIEEAIERADSEDDDGMTEEERAMVEEFEENIVSGEWLANFRAESNGDVQFTKAEHDKADEYLMSIGKDPANYGGYSSDTKHTGESSVKGLREGFNYRRDR